MYRTTLLQRRWVLAALVVAGAAVSFALVLRASTALADSNTSDFEPATYSVSSINGQDSWTMTGSYDAAVVANTYGFGSFGTQALRISDAVTSESFGDQVFAKPLADSVGEASSTDGTFTEGTKQTHFEMQFDLASASSTLQPGMHLSVSPDRGDGSRMSYLRFEDQSDGIHVFFDDVTDAGPVGTAATFNESDIATISRDPHTIKLTLDTLDGPGNDVVNVYIDGSLVKTGTSWEDYYRYDPEASAEQSPRIVKTVLFRESGAANPADAGNGFLIDNVALTSNSGTAAASTVKVTIDKFVDGQMATAASANNSSFPMQTTYSASNIGSGTDVPFSIGPTGFNSPNPYEAVTSDMSSGANYKVNEITGGDVVGASCADGKPYALAGYTTGDSLAQAQAATPTMTVPDFSNLQNDKYVIVWNHDCSQPDKVTIVKYIDGEHATAANAASSTFPFIADYDATSGGNHIAGSDPYEIGPVGNNTDNSYEADTLDFEPGASYATHEVTGGDTVGASCADGKPYALTGYTWGNSLEEAQSGTATTTAPSFTNLQNHKYVIAWNETCGEAQGPATLTIVKHAMGGDGTFNFTVTGATTTATQLTTSEGMATSTDIQLPAGTSTVSELVSPGWDFTDSSCVYDNESVGQQVADGEQIFVNDGDHVTCTFTNTMTPAPQNELKVHIYKYVETASSTAAQVPDNSTDAPFPMEATWNATNIGAGTGNYVLGNNHGGATLRYAADTASMSAPADYATHEVTSDMASSSQVLATGAQCQDGKFRLEGYKTGASLAAAQAAALSTTTPTFTGLTSDRYVIVVNRDCSTSGQIGGDVTGDNGVLAVTSIDAVDTTATADNTYTDGWSYVFHITVPTNEPGIAMKFSDWLSGSSTIPVANNMRISSAQADNAGATITVTAANAYTTPDLHMVTDLDPATPGIQTQVTVDVKIPVGTTNGSYTTNYGVRSE